MNEKKVKIAIFGGIIFGLFIVWAVGSSYIYNLRKENFKIRVNDTLSAYGRQIEDVYINGTYVGVYVDGARYEKADKATQETWQKEVVSLIRIDAVKSEILKEGEVTVSFFTDQRSIDSVARYIIKE